jgi:hypothetical protein
LNPFDFVANKDELFSMITLNNLSTTIDSSVQNKPAIYLARRTLKLLKAIGYAKAGTNSSGAAYLGFNFNVWLTSCYYNGIECDDKNFYKWYSFDYGNCYTFNYLSTSNATIRQTSKTGRENGLSLELFRGVLGM